MLKKIIAMLKKTLTMLKKVIMLVLVAVNLVAVLFLGIDSPKWSQKIMYFCGVVLFGYMLWSLLTSEEDQAQEKPVQQASPEKKESTTLCCDDTELLVQQASPEKKEQPAAVLEKQEEQAPPEKEETLLERGKRGDHRAMLELSKGDNEKIANLWLVRAVLYGNEEAREILRSAPQRACDTLFDFRSLIPDERRLCFEGYYSGAELQELGFDGLPWLDESYSVGGLSWERVFVLGMVSGYEPPDEDGYGAETYYNYYVYDEFFHRISPDVFEDNPYGAYAFGCKYLETCGKLPDLRVDWLIEDGIFKPRRISKYAIE